MGYRMGILVRNGLNIIFPAIIYLFKVNNRNTRHPAIRCSKVNNKLWTKCEICSKLTIKMPERRKWRQSGVFIINFEHISHLFLMTSLQCFYCWPRIYFTSSSSVSIFNSEQINVSWVTIDKTYLPKLKYLSK